MASECPRDALCSLTDLRSPAPPLLLAAALGGCGGAGLAGGPAAGSRRLPAELQPIAAGTPAFS